MSEKLSPGERETLDQFQGRAGAARRRIAANLNAREFGSKGGTTGTKRP